MEAIGYVRISKKDQSQHSLEYQERSIKDYCQRNSLKLASLFVDDGESSYTFDRPDYIALENFIKKHKGKVKYLVVFDHDRFSRNLPEALQKIESLEKKHGLKVISTSEALDIDTTDPSVFLQRAFKYLIANQELLTIRRRAKASARHAQESGRYINRAPFGYLNSKERETGKPLLVIDETKAYIVQKVFRDFLAGVPRYLIHKEVKALGFPQSGNGAIFRILINPLYAGLVRVCAHGKLPERIVKAIHKPIISESQYWRAQEMLGLTKRVMKSQPKEEFPLKGILKSPCCGENMTAGWSKGKKKYYLYYRCISHSNVNIPGAMLHDKFDELLRNISFTQNYIDEIVTKVRNGLKSSLNIRDQQLKVVKEQLANVEARIESVEKKLLDDTINGDTYKKWMKKFSTERARLTDEFSYLEVDLEDQLNQELLVLPYMLNLPEIFKEASINQRHAILNEVFKQGLTFKEGMFRTPSINPAFTHNLLILKKIRLLEIEEPPTELLPVSLSGERGIRTPGPVTVNGFQDRRIRPLCHLSGGKSTNLPLISK